MTLTPSESFCVQSIADGCELEVQVNINSSHPLMSGPGINAWLICYIPARVVQSLLKKGALVREGRLYVLPSTRSAALSS